jgi:O-antigen ligase
MIQQVKTLIYVLAALGAGLFVVRICVAPHLRNTLVKMLTIATIASQVIAFLSPALLIYNVAVALLIPLLARKRHEIAPLYLYLLFTLPLVSTPLTLGGIYVLTYDIGISLALGAFLGFAIAGSWRGQGSLMVDLLVVLLAVLFTLAFARGTSATNFTRVALDQTCLLVVPYLIVRRAILAPEDLQRILVAMAVAAAALSALALFEAFRAWPVYRPVWDHYGIGLGSGASVKLRAGFLRSPGPYPEPTSFALVLAVGLIAATAVKSAFASRAKHYLLVALLVAGILAPQSRGAWLGAAAGVLAIALYLRNWPLLARSSVAFVVTGLAAMVASVFSDRFAGVLGDYNNMTIATDYRTTLFSRGVQEFWKSPITGASFTHVIQALSDITQGEGLVDFVNSYLFVALISGAVGLLLYGLTMLLPLVHMLVNRARYASAQNLLSSKAAVFGAITAMAVMLGFTSLGGRTTIMLVILLALAGSRPLRAR